MFKFTCTPTLGVLTPRAKQSVGEEMGGKIKVVEVVQKELSQNNFCLWNRYTASVVYYTCW